MVVVSGVAYGDGGGGMPGLLLGSPRDDQGNLIMLGTGQQHWSTVHVADLADFFRRVLEPDAPRGYYIVGDGLNPSSIGLHPTQDSSRSSATGATATDVSRSLVDRTDQLLNTVQGTLVAGATPDESPPSQDSDGESDRAGR